MSADGIAEGLGDPVPLRDLLARNLHRLRGAATPEDVVRAARRHGLDWTSAWVTGAERGQRPVSAEQLLALPIVLTDIVGHRVSLADLLQGDEPVLLTKPDSYAPAATLSAAYLREVLTAAPSHRAFTTPAPAAPSADDAVGRAAEKMREIGRAGLGNVDVRALARAEAGAGDLEEKLARRLGVAPIVVIAAAAALWGRSLTEERSDRLSPDPYAEGNSAGPKPSAVMRRLTADITGRLASAEESLRAAEAAETTRALAEAAPALTEAAPALAATAPALAEAAPALAEAAPALAEAAPALADEASAADDAVAADRGASTDRAVSTDWAASTDRAASMDRPAPAEDAVAANELDDAVEPVRADFGVAPVVPAQRPPLEAEHAPA